MTSTIISPVVGVPGIAACPSMIYLQPGSLNICASITSPRTYGPTTLLTLVDGIRPTVNPAGRKFLVEASVCTLRSLTSISWSGDVLAAVAVLRMETSRVTSLVVIVVGKMPDGCPLLDAVTRGYE